MTEKRAQRRLAAILAADVVGYSRLMEQDEAGTLAALKTRRKNVLVPLVAQHNGRVVKIMGDGVLVEFASAVDAVQCAVELQEGFATANSGLPETNHIVLRIGINLGDVIVEGSDIYGDGVNIAARLETIAEPGCICVSGKVHEETLAKVKLTFEDMGERTLKNINRPVRCFHIGLASAKQPIPSLRNQSGKPTIAVLPFANLSGDPEQEYFADGITEDIITDLSKISALFVVGRNSVLTYKGRLVKLQDAARELGVKFLLEGTVRKSGQRVRITAQLIIGSSGGHLWAERYDRDLTDIFSLQDEISRAIVEELRIKLLPEEKKAIEQARTGNVEAYNFYLKGRHFFHFGTKSFLVLARRMFANAIEVDPTYARAYANIAICDARLMSWHAVKIPATEILATASRALTLEPNLAEAHAACGIAFVIADRKVEASSEFEQAIAIDPRCYDAHFFYGWHCFSLGNFEEAAKHYKVATELQSDDYRSPIFLRSAYEALGNKAEALKYSRLGLERADAALKLYPESSNPAMLGACVLASMGDKDKAKQWLAHAAAIDPNGSLTKYNSACVYALLGDVDQAFDILEDWVSQVDSHAKGWLRNDPDLDPLRQLPRYQKLLQLAR